MTVRVVSDTKPDLQPRHPFQSLFLPDAWVQLIHPVNEVKSQNQRNHQFT